ncbi:hypothetical protein TASCI_100009 [Tenacibaculum ascidiaceicola]
MEQEQLIHIKVLIPVTKVTLVWVQLGTSQLDIISNIIIRNKLKTTSHEVVFLCRKFSIFTLTKNV